MRRRRWRGATWGGSEYDSAGVRGVGAGHDRNQRFGALVDAQIIRNGAAVEAQGFLGTRELAGEERVDRFEILPDRFGVEARDFDGGGEQRSFVDNLEIENYAVRVFERFVVVVDGANEAGFESAGNGFADGGFVDLDAGAESG